MLWDTMHRERIGTIEYTVNSHTCLLPTDDDKTDNTVASVLGKDQPNILSFNQRPKEWIIYIPFLSLCLFGIFNRNTF